MGVLAITVGTSGSGKSTYYEKNYLHYQRLCPDLIRKELTGNISDQSKNYEVWQTAYKCLPEMLDKGHVYFDATNMTKNTVKEILENALKSRELTSVVFLVFMDSLNWENCQMRVKKDISNGVDRSDTVNVKKKNDKTLIQAMSEKFQQFINPSDGNGLYDTIKMFSSQFFERGITVSVSSIRSNHN